MLRKDVQHERERGDQAERQAAEGRKRIDELLHELADARTVAMITGCEAGAPGSAEVSHGTDPRPPDSVSAETDPTAAIGIPTLSQAVEMLRQDVEHERERGDQAERQAAEGRKRIDELLHELADARTVAMITGCEAGAPGSAEVSHGTDPRPPDSVSAEPDPTAAIGL